MCLARACPMLAAMTTRITLELDLDDDTVRGHAIDSDGAQRGFCGWIGLMGVLDALLDEARTASATTPQGENHAHR